MIGNYKILKTLGEGGFGRTYIAEHCLLNKKVVIKQSLFKGDAARKITLNEASILWDCNHWALPTVKDVIQNEEGDILFVMSFIDGKELYKHVQEQGPLDPETACWISQRILSALYYLHYRGIVHRDVKPGNIIVDFTAHQATLVDFGLSKLKPDGTPDTTGYTPFFASPEQEAGKAVIPESDIYSLGMTMIHILGGDIRNKSLPNLPDQLAAFIMKLVRDDPMSRPRDCKDLNMELEGIREKIFKRKHTF